MQDLRTFEQFREKAEEAKTDKERNECLAHVRWFEQLIASLKRSQELIAESRAMLDGI